MNVIRVFLMGLRDGWKSPESLSSGMTFHDPVVNEAYDIGVNVGQFIRSPRRAEWRNQ